jgi:hypothetical protein
MENSEIILAIICPILTATLSTILSAVAFYLIKSNRDFFKILDDFRSKLPPPNKKAKIHSLNSIPFNTVDVTDAHYNLSDADVDSFHKKLEIFNYNRVIIGRKKIESFSKNIQRHLSNGKTTKFKLSTIQLLLEDERFDKMKPYMLGYRFGKFLGF